MGFFFCYVMGTEVGDATPGGEPVNSTFVSKLMSSRNVTSSEVGLAWAMLSLITTEGNVLNSSPINCVASTSPLNVAISCSVPCNTAVWSDTRLPGAPVPPPARRRCAHRPMLDHDLADCEGRSLESCLVGFQVQEYSVADHGHTKLGGVRGQDVRR